MVSPILVVLAVAILILKCYKYMVARPKGFPPGPPKIPVFGTYLFLMFLNYKFLHKASITFSKWYKSKIIGFYLGDAPTVVVHDEQAIKKVLNSQIFEGRPDGFVIRMRELNFKHNGIFFNEGPQLIESRRFILRNLRDYGFGRRFDELEAVMADNVQDFVDLIKEGPKFSYEGKYVQNGKLLSPYIFAPTVLSTFIHILTNERLTREEQAEIYEMCDYSHKSVRNGDDYGKILGNIPWLRHIAPNMSGYKPLRESFKAFRKFSEKLYKKYDENYDPDNMRNFMDILNNEMKANETVFERDHVLMSLVDFLIPPSSTVSAQLGFLFNWMLNKPEIYQRMQSEIDEVVGSGRLPSLDDRVNLPYVEAVNREMLRIETVVPSSVPHKALEDTELDGFSIPKGTVVIPGLYASNSSKKLWGDPENFRPERFLNENGNLDLSKDYGLSFGAGRRNCAGETFSRNIMFLMIAAFCQNFDIVLGPGQKAPDLKNHHVPGVILTPKDFWLHVRNR
ncbi:hypothetical protein ACFFRR_006355 [Megaselia abdita]